MEDQTTYEQFLKDLKRQAGVPDHAEPVGVCMEIEEKEVPPQASEPTANPPPAGGLPDAPTVKPDDPCLAKLGPRDFVPVGDLVSPRLADLPPHLHQYLRQPKYLDRHHAHPRDLRIKMLESSEHGFHHYFVDGSCEHVLSGTGFVKAFMPGFDWRGVAEAKLASQTHLSKVHNPKYEGFGFTRAEQWRDYWNGLRDLGTLLHSNLEHLLNSLSPGPVHPENADLIPLFLQWFETSPWLKTYEVWRTEMQVFDENLKLAGTIDLVLRHPVTGHVVIVDFKRSKGITHFVREEYRRYCSGPLCDQYDTKWLQYALQLTFYAYLGETRYGWQIDGLVLLRMHPNCIKRRTGVAEAEELVISYQRYKGKMQEMMACRRWALQETVRTQ